MVQPDPDHGDPKVELFLDFREDKKIKKNKKRERKWDRKHFLIGVWLKRGEKKKIMESRCFLI